jgi:dsRNA-specific ribonuclease
MSLPPLKVNLPSLSSLPPLTKLVEMKTANIEKVETVEVKKSMLPPLSPPPLKFETKKLSLPPLSPAAKSPVKSPAKSLAPLKVTTSVFVPKPEVVKPEIEKPVLTDSYVATFFGKRNGIEGKPVEGVNYTVETLSYMTSHNRADEMTKIIVDEMRGLGYDHFEVFENTSGIGGNTLSFLENEHVTKVHAYEILSERREILKKNIAMYNLQNKANVLYMEFSEKEIPCGSVLFIDAPWLPKEIKGQESTKEEYILEGLKVGDKTLEEWAANCPNCSLVVLKLPLNYRMNTDNMKNKKIKEINMKNVLMWILLNPHKSKQCENIEKYMERSRIQEEKEKEEYIRWSNDLKNFLRTEMLPRVTTSKEAIEKMLGESYLPLWEAVFTDSTFDPNQHRNYEIAEILGDAVLENVYLRFINQSYPNFNESQLSELKMVHLAKNVQSKISMSLGLGKYVRTRVRLGAAIYEDVLEAFFGTLEIVGDEAFRFAAGYGFCYNLAVNLYKDIPIEPSDLLANAKTLVKQSAERLRIIQPGSHLPEDSVEDDRGYVTFTISMPPNGMTILRNLGINIKTPVLARTVAKTKKMAGISAYKMALNTLNEIGVTPEFIEQIVNARDTTNAELLPYINAIQTRLKLEGFSTYTLTEIYKKGREGSKGSKYLQLIGIRPDGEKKVLATTFDAVVTALEGKKIVLSLYSNYEN